MYALTYVIPLILCAMFGLFLAIFLTRIRYLPGTRSLVILIAAVSVWSASYAMEFLTPGVEGKIFWAKLQYLGIVAVPLAWLFFTYRYLGVEDWPPSPLLTEALLTFLPALTIILVWTNERHHLVWQHIYLQTEGPLQYLIYEHGPWFWIFWFYGYILIFIGTFRLIETLGNSTRLYRWQVRLALFASIAPWLANLLYVSGLSPIKNIDITPFAFIISGLFLTFSIFRYQLTNILPIARQQVFDGQPDSLIVLDVQDIIVDLNPAAEALLGESGRQAAGKGFSRVFPKLAPALEQAVKAGDYQGGLVEGEWPDQRFYDVHISPISGARPEPIGRLVVLHEVTGHKQEQARLEQDRSELERVVTERTEEMRTTVERLKYEFTQRAQAEQRLQAEKRLLEVIQSSPEAVDLMNQKADLPISKTPGSSHT